MRCLEASLALYAALGSESTASRELSITTLTIGAPLTQPLTYRASEAVCWVTLTMAQVNSGQPSQWRRALALSKESQNDGVQVTSTVDLTHALLEAGAYEEALVLTQHTLALARTLPLRVIFQRFLTVLGSVSHALQQWEEARRTLEEAVAVAEGPLCVPALTRLCMHSAEAGRWEQAYSYAMKVINIRKRFERLLIMWEFYPHYETEALLRGGDERQAREAVQRHGERPGPNRRYRLSYLRSVAVLAAWDGHSEQAIGHLCEAAQIAADLGLPAEQWQIQAALGNLYEARGEPAQARMAFGEALRIIQRLAEGIGDEARRSRFLTGPQIHPVVQHAQRLANAIPDDYVEPSGG